MYIHEVALTLFRERPKVATPKEVGEVYTKKGCQTPYRKNWGGFRDIKKVPDSFYFSMTVEAHIRSLHRHTYEILPIFDRPYFRLFSWFFQEVRETPYRKNLGGFRDIEKVPDSHYFLISWFFQRGQRKPL